MTGTPVISWLDNTYIRIGAHSVEMLFLRVLQLPTADTKAGPLLYISPYSPRQIRYV
jgi:hypothetical protein